MWVSAEAADRDGDVRFELFDQYAADDIDRLRERIRQETAGRPAPHLEPRGRNAPYLDEDLCTATDVVFSHRDDPKPRDTLGNLQRHALAILAGEVVGVEQGFLAGQPTSLLTVEVGSTLRASGELAAEGPLYVAYPYAVFAVGSDVFCAIDPRFDYRPKVGDRLLLFPSQPPADQQHRLLVPEPEELIAEESPGVLFIPEKLRGDQTLGQIGNLHDLRGIVQAREYEGGFEGAAP
jgi:hypothetical protein